MAGSPQQFCIVVENSDKPGVVIPPPESPLSSGSVKSLHRGDFKTVTKSKIIHQASALTPSVTQSVHHDGR